MVVVAFFAAVVAGGGALLGSEHRNLGLMVVAAGLVAVVLEPLHGRVRVWAERLVDGQRVSVAEVVGRLSMEMGHQDDPEEVLGAIAEVTCEATGGRDAVVWLRIEREMWPAASHPASWELHPLIGGVDELADLDHVAITVPIGGSTDDAARQVEPLGAITVSHSEEPGSSELLRPVEQRLLHDLASSARNVVRALQLRESRRHRLAIADRQRRELLAARRRVASAQLAERQRLERDLHDTAQQRAVALGAKLGLARTLTTTDPRQAATILTEAEHDIERLSTSLLDTAAGRAPPGLLDDGIGAALQATTSDLPVRVEVIDETRRPPSARVSREVFACCSEAVQNALKHAACSRIEVRLHDDGGALEFQVRDDGGGFDPDDGSGSGLANMRQRLDVLGGELELRSGPRGTAVRGRIPDSTVEAVA